VLQGFLLRLMLAAPLLRRSARRAGAAVCVPVTLRPAARGPAGPAHLPDLSGQPPGFGERAPEQELDLRVGAAQLIRRPPGQRVMHGRIKPEQDALTLSHAATQLAGCAVSPSASYHE
jgi:hypothetical protein